MIGVVMLIVMLVLLALGRADRVLHWVGIDRGNSDGWVFSTVDHRAQQHAERNGFVSAHGGSFFRAGRRFDESRRHHDSARELCQSSGWRHSWRPRASQYHGEHVVRGHYRFRARRHRCNWPHHDPSHGAGRLRPPLCRRGHRGFLHHRTDYSSQHYDGAVRRNRRRFDWWTVPRRCRSWRSHRRRFDGDVLRYGPPAKLSRARSAGDEGICLENDARRDDRIADAGDYPRRYFWWRDDTNPSRRPSPRSTP